MLLVNKRLPRSQDRDGVCGGPVRIDGLSVAPFRRRRAGDGGPRISLVNGGSAVAAIIATRYSPFGTLERYLKQ
jgi:hypothetical protein